MHGYSNLSLFGCKLWRWSRGFLSAGQDGPITVWIMITSAIKKKCIIYTFPYLNFYIYAKNESLKLTG